MNTSGYYSTLKGICHIEFVLHALEAQKPTTKLNGQELPITTQEPENMEAAFNVTGERRKALIEAVKAFVDAPAVYQERTQLRLYHRRLHGQQDRHGIRPSERSPHSRTECKRFYCRIRRNFPTSAGLLCLSIGVTISQKSGVKS